MSKRKLKVKKKGPTPTNHCPVLAGQDRGKKEVRCLPISLRQRLVGS